jgi:anti-sigma regulatory factor (Ser/Thr protein kinase)
MGWSPGGVDHRPPRRGAHRREADLPATSEAPQLARRLVRDALGDLLSAAYLHEAALMVSELVTNSLRHSGAGADDRLHLAVDASHHSARVAVTDPGPGFDPISSGPPAEMERGRGLGIVESLAWRWGVQSGPPTEVWFEVPLRPT